MRRGFRALRVVERIELQSDRWNNLVEPLLVPPKTPRRCRGDCGRRFRPSTAAASAARAALQHPGVVEGVFGGLAEGVFGGVVAAVFGGDKRRFTNGRRRGFAY
jgi:hypothetical protein